MTMIQRVLVWARLIVSTGAALDSQLDGQVLYVEPNESPYFLI